MEIKDCRDSDFNSVVALLRQLWPEIAFDLVRLGKSLKACSASDSFALFCAHDLGRVVGFCEVHFRENVLRQGMTAFVDIIAVDETQRRSGLGSALLAIARGRAQRMDCGYMELDLSLQHEESQLFFESHGFERSGYALSKKIPARGG
jgi:ribosomal protein S18 acetylase RimI-like enzyme